MPSPITVGVLLGGVSSEHPVSLVSGSGMLRNLDLTQYIGFPIIISMQNEWIWPKEFIPGEFADFTPDKAKALLASTPENWHRLSFPHFSAFPSCDIFLIGLHGVGGEDGRLQGFFELMGKRYTGSGSVGSALSMDKILSKQIYTQNNIPTAPYEILLASQYQDQSLLEAIMQRLQYPVVVKDPLGGSSIGLGIAKEPEELAALIKKLGVQAKRLLLEAFLPGDEATCGYLEHASALPPTQIKPLQDAYFNFEAKYIPGRTEEITPAPFSEMLIKELQALSKKCHEALQLSVYSRTDFRIVEGKPYILETNNLPGFTPTSILPQQASCIGLSYQALLSHILQESLRK